MEISPSLHFAIARQQLELSPEDAERLGIAAGEQVQISQPDDSDAGQSGEAGGRGAVRRGGTRLTAAVAVRSGIPQGTAFLADGIAADSANALTEPTIEVSRSETKPSGTRGLDGREPERRPRPQQDTG